MSFGIGIDLEKTDRFKMKGKPSYRLLSKLFTKNEMKYCLSKADPSVHLAGIFAAKEAAFKALSSFGDFNLQLSDFAISHRKYGGPTVAYLGSSPLLKSAEIMVSLSHTKENAVAVVFAVL